MPALPAGSILLWSGSLGAIPDGFLLCDGQAGTPDLRDRFIIGTSETYHMRDTGGSLLHDHDFTSDGHSHTMPSGPNLAAGPDYSQTSTSDTDSGTTDETNTLPPYYALAYILKT